MLKICSKKIIYRAVPRIFLTGRLFATIKILVILLVTDLTSSIKIAFSNSIFNTKNGFF